MDIYRKTAVLSLLFLLSVCGSAYAEDCTRKFPAGEYGIPVSDAVLASGALPCDGLRPVYLIKRKVEDTPELCRYVNVFDVFRLTLEKGEGRLFAGCTVDLNGDGKKDYVLLLAGNADTRKAVLTAFINTSKGYRGIPLSNTGGGPGDDELIPHCIRKPAGGIFTGLEGARYAVTGDLVTYGWYTYYWEKDGFKQVLTSD